MSFYGTDHQWLRDAKAFNARLNSAHHIDCESGKVVALYGVPLSYMAIRDDTQLKIIPGVLGESYKELLSNLHDDVISLDILRQGMTRQTTLGVLKANQHNIAIENAFDLSDEQLYALAGQVSEDYNLLLMFKSDSQRQLEQLPALERMYCTAA